MRTDHIESANKLADLAAADAEKRAGVLEDVAKELKAHLTVAEAEVQRLKSEIDAIESEVVATRAFAQQRRIFIAGPAPRQQTSGASPPSGSPDGPIHRSQAA